MKLKSNFDTKKKFPLSRPLFTKNRNHNIHESNAIDTINNNKKRILSEYDLSGLNNKLLLTETNSKRDLYSLQLSEGNEPQTTKHKSIESQYLNSQLNQLEVPKSIMKGVYNGLGNTLQAIQSDIVNDQLLLSPISKSVKELISTKTGEQSQNTDINNTNNTSMTQNTIKVIKDLKDKEVKIKKSLYKLDHNQKELEKESYSNISNSIIDVHIRNDQLREIKAKKESLYEKLDEVNQRVLKIIEDNKPLNRSENIKQFLDNFDFAKDEYPHKMRKYEEQSMQLKEKRLNDLAIAQDKKKRNLDQIEKEAKEQKERLLTELNEKEATIIKKRKQEMDSQMDKTKQYIKEQLNKTEKDYLFYVNKEKYELEQKKLNDKLKMQKKEELLSQEDFKIITNQLKENKVKLNKENAEKVILMKEMWKNRAELLPSFKSQFETLIEEERRKAKEKEELMLQKRQQQIKESIVYAEHIAKPTICKALQREREARIYRLNHKRNVKRKKHQRKEMSIDIPKVHKKTNSELPQFTKPLNQLEVLPNYLEELKRKREQSTSPIPVRNWEKELNDNKGNIIENLELVQIQTDVIDKKVQQKKQFMKANGGYAKQTEIGDAIGDLLIDSIKAKLLIINKLKGKPYQ